MRRLRQVNAFVNGINTRTIRYSLMIGGAIVFLFSGYVLKVVWITVAGWLLFTLGIGLHLLNMWRSHRYPIQRDRDE